MTKQEEIRGILRTETGEEYHLRHTREEIREGIHWDTALARIIIESGLLLPQTPYQRVVELAKVILEYQDSQGIVIKTDRELPMIFGSEVTNE